MIGAFMKQRAFLSRDLSPRRYNLGDEDIHVGMRFPSGIAAGPVPAESTGCRGARDDPSDSPANRFKHIQSYSPIYTQIASPYRNSRRDYNGARVVVSPLSFASGTPLYDVGEIQQSVSRGTN